jgi:hypothetical protein
MQAERDVLKAPFAAQPLDLQEAGDLEDLYLAVRVDTAVTSNGEGTVAIALVTAEDEAFTAPKTIFTTAAIAKADLTAGSFPVVVKVPRGVLRFLKVVYTIGTAALTAGKFDAFLTPQVPVKYA